MVAIERAEPAYQLDEREMLRAWLDYHRATLALKCEGLTDEQLREYAVPPSQLSLLGLVRHMGGVERWWFRVVFDGQDDVERYPDNSEWRDLDKLDAEGVSADFAIWREEWDKARAIETAASSLDLTGAEHYRGEDSKVSLRWFMAHMIEEYARHNGHGALLRECIDGKVGD